MPTDVVVQSFVVEFASLVTVPSCRAKDMVARNGKESIYALLIRLLPGVSFESFMVTVNSAHSVCNVLLSILRPYALNPDRLSQIQHAGTRRGCLTASAFNKILQSRCGFVRSRTRRKSYVRYPYLFVLTF
jgi:hypothetical protein